MKLGEELLAFGAECDGLALEGQRRGGVVERRGLRQQADQQAAGTGRERGPRSAGRGALRSPAGTAGAAAAGAGEEVDVDGTPAGGIGGTR